MDNKEKRTKEFGAAQDYYRVRLLRMEEQLPENLDWRDDVLYASPKAYPGRLKVTYRIQILSSRNEVYELASLKDKADAQFRLKKMRKDLVSMTKREYDQKYKLEEYVSMGERKDARNAPILHDPITRDSIVFMGVRNIKEENRN